ncbi:MAG: ABC transporter substrate-binding protein [Proteobacteria bacterium]|jgi:branched-chain amino acid transport system substrate-binding protein|nr:ABC transporter substrate-binding protein [Pseudomonadota bacterium]MCG2742514.1 ABC transporter substrate-binding protein [Desulfobacteraceae bacterium]MBU3981954.1 ABC transporter substrate-binding protein [Pseudomonadota bacterium]MBU4028174.1 ABC transporter substrate-binding protein [Pseudomonadota bacterium]MBU4041280.1 ABC transporter substrate-binding protein [Pseudomonadota bacterium]
MKSATIIVGGKRSVWHILLMLLLCVIVTLTVSCNRQPEPIRIGAIISLTGSGGYLSDLRDAMLMAVEEINGNGGMNGHPIELFIEDSKSDPEEGKKAMAQLEAQHHPVLYLSTLSPVSMALAPMAERMEVPLIGLVTSAQDFTTDKKWVFRYYPMASDEVTPVISILDKQGSKRLGIFYQSGPYGQSVTQLLSAACKAQAGWSVTEQHFTEDDFNIQDKIAKLGEVDGLYVVGQVNFISKVIKQVRQAGFNRQIITSSGGAWPGFLTMAEFEGIRLAAPLLYNKNYPYAQNLRDKYTARFNRPLDHQSAVGYDILFLLRGLLQNVPVSRANIKKVLEQGYHFPSAMGDILVPRGSHEINFHLYPARIKNGAIIFGD